MKIRHAALSLAGLALIFFGGLASAQSVQDLMKQADGIGMDGDHTKAAFAKIQTYAGG